jgi:MipA family protein
VGRWLTLIALCMYFAWGGRAHAEDRAPDRLSIGIGVLAVPDYEGSDDYLFTPAAGALARIDGHLIAVRGASLSFDIVPEYPGRKAKWIIAPLVGLRLDRIETPKDPVVRLLRKRKVALEAGGVLGYTMNGVLTSPYDSLTVRVTASADIGTVHRGWQVSPSVEYLMPVSKRALLGASLSADIVGSHFARFYYGVGTRASAVSGLPEFRPEGGLKSVTVGLTGAHALGPDIRKGFVIGGIVGYSRILRPFANSPLVATRGNANQFYATVGLGYTF